MRKFFSVLCMTILFSCASVYAEEVQKSGLQQLAEAENEKGNIAGARFNYIRAFEDYAGKGKLQEAVDCGTKATALYYKENYYKEAFELLRRIEQQVMSAKLNSPDAATLYYQTIKQRMLMYMKLHRGANVLEQLNNMEIQANTSSDEKVKNDLLYNKAIYYYTYGQPAKGNAVFKEMAGKLTNSKEYDKVEEVYKTLIANSRRSNNASLVAQSYSSYNAWKDSVSAIKHADEVNALKQQIADNETTIADKDSSLTTRKAVIAGLGVLAAILAAALAIGAVVLLRFIVLTRKQKQTIKEVKENNALKAQFISNISSQLEPTLQKLDRRIPEVEAMQQFTAHIQTLASLERTDEQPIALENTLVPPFCEKLIDGVRSKAKANVTLKVDAPKMSVKMNQEYVSHILSHLLDNAVEYTPEGGTISLDFKKRGAHTFQFLVTDTGCGIPEDRRENLFKPFVEIRDLTKGDGLGLPICKQMALKMDGDLYIDTAFTKGTRFVLNLHS